jgi:hypothetical protein
MMLLMLLMMNGDKNILGSSHHRHRRFRLDAPLTAATTAAAAKLVNRHDVLAQIRWLDAGVRTVVALVVLLLLVHEAHVLGEVGHVLATLEANFPVHESQISTWLLVIETSVGGSGPF